MAPAALFTEEQIREDGRNRVAKTGLQAGGLAAPLILIVVEGLKARDLLHGDISTELTLAYQAVLTTLFAAAMNLRRLRGKA